MLYALHFDAHAASTAGDSANCRIHISRRQIGHLCLCNFFRLLSCQTAYLIGVRLGTTLADSRRFLYQHRRGRGLHDKSEALVSISRYDNRHRQPDFHLLRSGIERLAKLHDVESPLAERRTNWRTWIGLTRGYLQLDITDYFLCHDNSPLGYKRTCCSPHSINNQAALPIREEGSARPISSFLDLAEIQF